MRPRRWLATLASVALCACALAPAAVGHERREPHSLIGLPALPASSQSPDEPDLRISLPSGAYTGQVAPVYLDAFERPGRLLYRFDSLIHNQGGALDLYGGEDEVRQRIWPGGDPSTEPVPDAAPPGVGDDRFDDGARFRYVEEDTHEHWHFFSAAGYELLVPGEAPRVSDKIGFCMFDSFGTPGGQTWWFPEEAPGPATWCRFSEPASTFVRMGLSRGATDRYSSQREFQYVDVTGVAPGEYVLRAEANPLGHIAEADVTDNVLEEVRIIPGVRAAAVAVGGTVGTRLSATLTAEVVAPDVPARRSGSCRPSTSSRGCYVWPEDEPVTFSIASPPAHGTAAVDGSSLTYTPVEGFEGVDRLTYVATDPRGLVSAPASVELTVARRHTVAPPPPATPPPEVTQPRRLLRLGPARQTRRAVIVPVFCRPTARGACTGTVTARLAGRRLARRAFAGLPAGQTRFIRLHLSRADRRALARSPRRRIALTATVRDGVGAGVQARRVLARR